MTATLDRTFFAISDPTLRGILDRLADGPATIGELAAPYGLTRNGVKKHVEVLEEVDLVITTKVGRARQCRRVSLSCKKSPTGSTRIAGRWSDGCSGFATYVEARTAGST